MCRPSRVYDKVNFSALRKCCSSVVAEELVAKAADEANRDRLGHGVRVVPRGASKEPAGVGGHGW